jgi:hypothetical protein
VVPLALLAAGCGEEFEPRSLLQSYRVVGIAADRPEIGPDDTVTLRVYDFDPASVAQAPVAETPYYIWVVCGYSLGSVVQYDCIDPRLEAAVRTDGPTLTLDLRHPPWGGPDLRTQYAVAAAEAEARGVGDVFDLEEGVPLTVKLYSGRDGVGHVDSVKQVLVREGDATVRNRNPEIAAFRIGGLDGVLSVPTGDEVFLEVEMAPGSAETYVDPLTGETTTEELLYSWFTSGGAVDPERGYGDRTQTVLTVPETPQRLRLFVAVRDGRGGLAVAEQTIDVLAPP